MSQAPAKQPNILMIMVDQCTAAALPMYGHPLVKAPHLSRLADRGTVFDNAYCNFPLCVPSRASMLSGRLSSSIGVWDNATETPAETPMMGHCLRACGYSATLAGKMHFVGPDQMHGFEERTCTDIYPANFAWTPDWLEGPRNRPTGINMRAVIDSGVCVRSMQIDYDEEVTYTAKQKIYDLARYDNDRPFFLTVSFTQPHSPFITTQKYWDLYDNDDIDMPSVPPIPLDEADTMSRWLHYAHGGDLDDVSEADVRNARHAYYGMISSIDDKIGEIMAVLDATNASEDTYIVFTADHGEMLGERGMWYKQSFFENSAKIPLIIKAPGQREAARVATNVSLIDLLPTFLDIAGRDPADTSFPPLAGESLLPLLAEPGLIQDRPVISEYTGEGVCAPCRMVKKGACKYIYTHGHPAQLYDIERDPLERYNVDDDPAYAAVRAELERIVFDGWEPDRILENVLASQRRRLFIHCVTEGDPAWALQVRHDDLRRYVRNAGAVQAKARARYPQLAPES